MGYYEPSTDQVQAFTIWYDNKLGLDKHFHRSFEFIYLLSGKLEITYYEKVFTLVPNQIFCADSFSPHSLTDPDGNSTAIVTIIPSFFINDLHTMFEKQFFEPVLRNVNYNKHSVLPILEFFCLNKDKKNVDRITNPYKNHLVGKGIANVIIGQLLQYKLVDKKKHNKNITTLISILQYIEIHYKEDITLDKLAAKFNYNKYYISKIFNKNIGQNLRTYINTLRFQSLQTEIAALRDNSPALESIIGDFGFTSSTTFYRTQKKNKDSYDKPKKYGK